MLENTFQMLESFPHTGYRPNDPPLPAPPIRCTVTHNDHTTYTDYIEQKKTNLLAQLDR